MDTLIINEKEYTWEQIQTAMRRYEKENERLRQKYHRKYVPHPKPMKPTPPEESKRPRGRPKKAPADAPPSVPA